MANPIIECVQSTGLNLYAIQKNRLTGQTGNNTAMAWQSYNVANWALYAIALTEDGASGYYWAARPAWAVDALISDVLYIRAGGSPAVGDAPPFNLLHNQGENVAAISADASAAPQNLAAALTTEVQGAVVAGTLTNSYFPTTVTGYADNLFVGRSLLFTSGTLQGSSVPVLSYNGSTGVFGVGPLVGAPSVDDAFILV